MKHIHYYIIIAFVCAIFTGCMDNDWDIPGTDGSEFGNQAVTETNLVTIAQLKQKYALIINDGSYTKLTEPTQIKGVVTGNDVQGNIYNEIAIEDGTGSILICIAQGGLCGQLQVGREILVELQDLYIGSYEQQPEIGTPYTNKNGKSYVSRMPRSLWMSHYKLLGMKDVSPIEFDLSKVSDSQYMRDNCGRLMTLKNVTFSKSKSIIENNGDSKDTLFVYAHDLYKNPANCVERSLEEVPSNNLVVYTSTYADFANKQIPLGQKVDITGIFTRYRNKWQILIREESDVVLK